VRSIRHLRGDKVLAEFDLYQFLMHGIRPPTERLEPGDAILVPPAGPEVTVAGMVRRPAIYELKGEKSIDDVVELSGGVLAAGALRQIRLERIEAHRSRVLFSLDLSDGDATPEARESLRTLGVQDGDRITVTPIAPYTSQTVYLEGHVSRPGKYPFKAGMDVGSLLHSYDDVLPEPSERAEIVRLEAPDFRPKVITFALSEVLDGSDPVELKPFDTIRIVGRYDDDAPKVSVVGEVMHPDEYPLSEGMTASMLLQMAGGFKRSAYTASADIASYVVQDGKKVSRQHSTFEIAKALAGERSADVLLKPGDVLSIRQLTGWGDIGASVVLNGEVRYPGTYGINDGERLSSVLRRAGGLLPSAYPPGSRLERQEVRELEEKSRMELIRQIETATPESRIKSASVGDATAAAQLMEQQKKQILATLRDEKVTGRMVIKITADIDKWQNTEFDPELRAGDVVAIPKRPNFVLVTGQVYNPTAIGFSSGESANWYLRQAGGPTESANKKKIFIVRANGSVIAGSGGDGLWGEGVLNARLEPGDTVIVPERIVGGSAFWKNLLSTAQIGSSIAIAASIAAGL
jgi:protein involved in polysaccharide export with SLBB domain